jgi:hypothetical protein
MEIYCPPQLRIIENYAIMEQPRIEHYKQDADYRRCLIVFDKAKMKIHMLGNFSSHYDHISDTSISPNLSAQATTFMVKSVFFEWWFIIQIIFPDTSAYFKKYWASIVMVLIYNL